MTNEQVAAVGRQFEISGTLSALTSYGNGHINDTYRAVFDQSGVPRRFILQRINTAIFDHPVELMENIQRVTAHVAAQLAGRPDSDRRVLTLIAARDGKPWHRDAAGAYWRAYRLVEGAQSRDTAASVEQAFQAARAFGEFQRMLVDLPAPRLHDTIPDFHNTPKRFAAFEQSVASDAAARALSARAEIDFALSRRSIAGVLLAANLPERVTHNDTKFNNVLFDEATGEGLCVVDLDTVMPGLALYDFGDMVRTAATTAGEDEQDLSRIALQFPLFEALVRGYLHSAGSFLNADEKRLLVEAGKVITFEQGIRFLADHLNGDPYYKVHRENHNLDRCRTQFKLIASIEEQQENMHRLVEQVISELSS